MAGLKQFAGLVAATACVLGSVTAVPVALADPPPGGLMAMLPPGFGPGNCKSYSSPYAGAVEAYNCGPNDDLAGPGGGVFLKFDNRGDLASAYKALLGTTTTAPCGQGWPAGSGTWNYQKSPNVVEGNIFCGNDKSKPDLAVLTWTLNSQLALGSVGGSDIPSLLQWWTNNGLFQNPAAPPASQRPMSAGPE
jgi:serine/threonine kinase PknH